MAYHRCHLGCHHVGDDVSLHQECAVEGAARVEQVVVVLFSHGAGCARLMHVGAVFDMTLLSDVADVGQSAVCGELASRGYIVAAIEHRDGTAPGVQVTNGRGQAKDVYWLNWIDLE